MNSLDVLLAGRSIRVLGVIPARGRSKRIPHKNIRPLHGSPLIAYTIRAAQDSQLLTTWVVSTDDEKIRDVALSFGAYVIRRPEELATDLTSSDEVALHALEWMGPGYDIVVLLHPTNPIRDPRHIDRAIETLWNSDAPSLASVEYAKRSYRHNASIYAVKTPFTKLYNDQTIPFLMDKKHSLDIDDEQDWQIAETWLKHSSDRSLATNANNGKSPKPHGELSWQWAG
jgi:CMP-N,N'-diacetyllegionaminic acid synthase